MTFCKEKVRYRDRIAALMSLATLRRQDKAGHAETRAYRCPHCHGWHLTSQDLRPRKDTTDAT